MSERTVAIIRLICAIFCGILSLSGIYMDVDILIEGIACLFALATLLWSWWKNNNLTEAAIEAQGILDDMREGVDITEIGDDDEDEEEDDDAGSEDEDQTEDDPEAELG